MPKAFAIVGVSGSGKTTLIEKLIPQLKDVGLRVATLKHSHHHLEPDKPGSDSLRHAQAGSCASAIVGPGLFSLRTSSEPSLEKMVDLLDEFCDLVLLEGFKTTNDYPKIEVVRHKSPALTESEVWLTATDLTMGRKNEVPLTDPKILIERVLGLFKTS